jgi:molybdenum cofactor cytidylyltransferase
VLVVRPNSPRIGCALLAAGSSQRLGRPKQLVTYRGVSLVRRSAQALASTRCEALAIVVGFQSGDVLQAVRGLPLEPLENANYSEGIAASIRLAVSWASARELDALVLAACDQVHLTAAHLEQLIARYTHVSDIVASAYADTCGIPALFGSAWFSRLSQLQGDRGAGALLRTHAQTQFVAWPEGELDIDTEADLARAIQHVSDSRAALRPSQRRT